MLITLVNRLPNLESVYVDGNGCWPVEVENDPQLRVLFIGGLSQMDRLNAKLKRLNGYPITIAERCRGLLEHHVYNAEGIERFRVELIWEKVNPKDDCTSLKLSGYEMRSIRDIPNRVMILPCLQELDLSNNKLSSLAELKNLMEVCSRVTMIDIRDNRFSGNLHDLMIVMKSATAKLRHLKIERSLKSNETDKPKDYISLVYSELPFLDSVDGFRCQVGRL